MFERNPLAVKDGFLIWDRRFLTVRRGETQIADTFGVCNLRPDSETVASRAFAQASGKIAKIGGNILSQFTG